MKVGRLHAALNAVHGDYSDNSVDELLKGLQAALVNYVNQPTPEQSTAFKESYSNLATALRDSDLNLSSPLRRQILDEINAFPQIGVGLLDRITLAIERNNITPADALTEIKTIIKEVNEYQENVHDLIALFENLELEYDELEEGQFEVGISLPCGITGGTLEGMEKEVHQLNQVFRTFKEVAGDEMTSVSFRHVSSSEWQIFLECVAQVALCTAVAIERIVALYKKLLEIRKLREEISKNVPKQALTSVDDYLKSVVEQGLQEIADDLLKDFYKGKVQGRQNELKSGLASALKYIADRTDHGATFEVRACEPEEPEAKSDQEAKSKDFRASLKKYRSELQIATKINQCGRASAQLASRDKPILMLGKQPRKRKSKKEGT